MTAAMHVCEAPRPDFPSSLSGMLPVGAEPRLEQLGLKLDSKTGGKFGLWPVSGVRWDRWLAFDDAFREGARKFMLSSRAFD